MKEIDFLPSWYISGRRRQMSYQTQYAVILCVLLAMAGWSFYTARSVSSAQASMGFTASQRDEIVGKVREFAQIRTRMAETARQATTLENLDTRIPTAEIIAEISYLIDTRIVLRELKIEAVPFETPSASQSSGTAVRLAREAPRAAAGTIEGPARCKVVIRGMAAEAGDVASLICKLEASAFFMDVIPCFSRTKEFRQRQVTEFEIGCFLENYKEEKL